MVVCSLHMISSRMRELHSLLLIAGALRHLQASCKSALQRMLRAQQSARSTLCKVFSLYGTADAAAAGGTAAKWDAIKETLRHELQVCVRRRECTADMHAGADAVLERAVSPALQMLSAACMADMHAGAGAVLKRHSVASAADVSQQPPGRARAQAGGAHV
jgi:hypothetical protein